MKSTKNVRLSPIQIISLLLASVMLSGCASLSDWVTGRKKVEPVVVQTKPVEKTPLALENPQPLRLRHIEWIVVTPENWEEVFKQIQAKEQNLVLFGLTSDGYQSLSLNISELRNMLNTQRIIIEKYKEYYEPVKPKGDNPK